jgi:hypothetical protein
MKGHSWPILRDGAYHGVFGDIVRAIEPETEADPAGILIQLLIMWGACLGRTPYFAVGADRHHMNEFGVIVGDTAKARKGMSRGQSERIFESIDPEFTQNRIMSGLSSGEGLIAAVADPGDDDRGSLDKRLLIVQTEFSATLKVMAREGNTLSEMIRDAWDGRDLRTLTKNNPLKASGPHISIIDVSPENDGSSQLE